MTQTLADLTLKAPLSEIADVKIAAKPATRKFPNFIDAYLAYTKEQEASAKIHRWVAVSTIAAALERKVWLNRQQMGLLFPNFYIFIIGASGIVRKSTSTGIGVELLQELKNFSMMSERVTEAALIAQMARAGREFRDYNGEAFKHSSLFCYAPELITFLREIFGSILPMLTRFYDCTPHDWRKPYISENKGEGATHIHGPCLNLLGASTPAWLTECIPHSQMEGGFASRVIFVVENDPPTKFIAWPGSKDAFGMKQDLVKDLARIHDMRGKFEVTQECYDWYATWYGEYMKGVASADDPRFSGYHARKGDHALKLAMVLSAAESDTYLITRDHIETATKWLTELESSMYDAFGATGANPTAPILKKIWKSIRANPKIEHGALLRLHCRDTNQRDFAIHLETLRSMQVIEAEMLTTNKGKTLLYTATERGFKL